MVLITPAHLRDLTAPNKGGDCSAAKHMAADVGWDDEGQRMQQLRIHDIWRSFMEVPKLAEDWRYFAQRGCLNLCVKDYISKVRAAMNSESLPICKKEALRGEPAAGLPDSRPYTYILGEQSW